MVEENEQYAYFAVRGTFDPERITQWVGVQPSESWQVGDICNRTHRERKASHWKLLSRLNRTQELEAHIADVLSQLDANPEAFKAVSKELGGCLNLVGYFHCEYPGLFFEQDLITRIASYSLAVDFDFYGLYSPRREFT